MTRRLRGALLAAIGLAALSVTFVVVLRETGSHGEREERADAEVSKSTSLSSNPVALSQASSPPERDMFASGEDLVDPIDLASDRAGLSDPSSSIEAWMPPGEVPVPYAPKTYDDPRYRAARDQFAAYVAPRVCPLFEDAPGADAVTFYGLDMRFNRSGRVFVMTGYSPFDILGARFRGDVPGSLFPRVPEAVVDWVLDEATDEMRGGSMQIRVDKAEQPDRATLAIDVLRSDCPSD